MAVFALIWFVNILVFKWSGQPANGIAALYLKTILVSILGILAMVFLIIGLVLAIKNDKDIEPTILKGASDSEIITELKRQLSADGRCLLGGNEKSGRRHLVSIEFAKGKIIIKDDQQFN